MPRKTSRARTAASASARACCSAAWRAGELDGPASGDRDALEDANAVLGERVRLDRIDLEEAELLATPQERDGEVGAHGGGRPGAFGGEVVGKERCSLINDLPAAPSPAAQALTECGLGKRSHRRTDNDLVPLHERDRATGEGDEVAEVIERGGENAGELLLRGGGDGDGIEELGLGQSAPNCAGLRGFSSPRRYHPQRQERT